MLSMAKGKLKMLYLIRIFMQETDDNHALTLQEIAAKLNAVNINADRKTLYSDFEDLRQFGFDILSCWWTLCRRRSSSRSANPVS